MTLNNNKLNIRLQSMIFKFGGDIRVKPMHEFFLDQIKLI